MDLVSIPNPDLCVSSGIKPRWDSPDHRRHAFHELPSTVRYATSLRASRILPLRKAIDWTIGDRPDVARFLAMRHFSAFVVARDDRILFEQYASDFGPSTPHSMMSVTKTTLNLMLGRCVSEGLIDLDRPVRDYLPEIGSGYADATVRATADMNVANDFPEDRYGVIEHAIGFRLPKEDEDEHTIRSYICKISSSDVVNRTGEALYKSPNSEVIAWIVERVSGTSLREWMIRIAEAAGIEDCLYVACDRDGVPALNGGMCLSARDLARYGLIFARRGKGIDGQWIGDPEFIEETRRNLTLPLMGTAEGVSYSYQMYTDGTWVGHAGYGGQFMLANPDTEIVVIYYGVFESVDGTSGSSGFDASLVKMMGEVAASY